MTNAQTVVKTICYAVFGRVKMCVRHRADYPALMFRAGLVLLVPYRPAYEALAVRPSGLFHFAPCSHGASINKSQKRFL